MINSRLKSYLLPSVGLLSLCVSATEAQAAKKKSKQPNIIFLLTDDQGYGDLACHGNTVIKTPNLDALHADAVRFTEFHVSPTSAPSRSGLMSGRYSNRVGVWHTINGRSLIWEDEVLLSQVLASNGYSCGIFGKWHLGDNYPSRPDDRGFDEVVIHGGGGVGQGPDYWDNDYFDDHYRHNGEWKQYKGYCTDIFFSEAMSFMEKNVKADKPFFCYIPVNAPHAPLNVPQKYLDMYQSSKEILSYQKRFYALITAVDDNFGLLMNKVKDLGIDDNTIIIFMTDNGTARGYRVMKEGGKIYGTNGGREGTKNSNLDGGHRVPFFIRYPDGGLTGGKDINTLTAHIDFLPTMIDYLDLKQGLPTKKFDGKSLVPLLEGKKVDWEDRILYVDSQREATIAKWRKTAVMSGKWRLLGAKVLYDIEADPRQQTNIAAEHPDVVKRLLTEYNRIWDEIAVEEDVNNRFGYIVAGGDENPVRINTHDMHTKQKGLSNQNVPLKAGKGQGIFKIEIKEDGKYKFSLCRYPLETGYKFNSEVAAIAKTKEIEDPRPKSEVKIYTRSTIEIGKHKAESKVDMSKSSMDFTFDMKKGRYDLDARFYDEKGTVYPSYYLYIEKIK
ncbi:MAG: arylsulfatase [Rikenellaceae bacterium]